MFSRLLLGVRSGIPGPATGLLMVAALVALSACGSPTSTVEPTIARPGQGLTVRDSQECQDWPVELVPASEPELPVTPTVTADAEPEDLMYSAVDLARPKG